MTATRIVINFLISFFYLFAGMVKPFMLCIKLILSFQDWKAFLKKLLHFILLKEFVRIKTVLECTK